MFNYIYIPSTDVSSWTIFERRTAIICQRVSFKKIYISGCPIWINLVISCRVLWKYVGVLFWSSYFYCPHLWRTSKFFLSFCHLLKTDIQNKKVFCTNLLSETINMLLCLALRKSKSESPYHRTGASNSVAKSRDKRRVTSRAATRARHIDDANLLGQNWFTVRKPHRIIQNSAPAGIQQHHQMMQTTAPILTVYSGPVFRGTSYCGFLVQQLGRHDRRTV